MIGMVHLVRDWLACCAVFTALIVPASAEGTPSQAMAAIWERFLNLCGPAMTDAEGFVANLPSIAPAGTYDAITASDGRLFKINISGQGGEYFDDYSRSLLKNTGSESCATHYIGPLVPEGSATANALEEFLRDQVGELNFSGGHFPELYTDYSQGTDLLIRNPDNFQYDVGNVLPDSELIAYIQIASGFISIGTFRHLTNQ